MKKRFNKLAGFMICIAFGVFLLFIKDKVDGIWLVICNVATILTPIIYGFALAYIINFPYRFFNKKVFGKIKNKKFQKLNRPLSLILSYTIFLGLLVFLAAILIPQIFENVSRLVSDVPTYVRSFREFATSTTKMLTERFNISSDVFDGLNDNVVSLLNSLTNFDNIPKVYAAAVSTAGVLFNWVMGFIFSIYMLASKDFIFSQLKRVGVAFLPSKWMTVIYEIIDVSDDKCGKFLVGKVIDSAIVGLLCFTCMSILNIPYAPLISVIVGVCNIIPFFGPFIGAIPSAALLLLVSPIYCLEFIIMIFIIQQLDGNVINPKVVGSQVGLIGFWSLFSVIVAGGLFGIPGMILGTPIFAAVYTLIGRLTRNKIEQKGEEAEELISMNVVKTGELINMKAKVKNPIKIHPISGNYSSDRSKNEENDSEEEEES